MIPTAFAPLASHLWQSTLFAAVAGLLTLALRRNQARVRYWLWLAASYKFLVPFSWLVSFGHLFQWRSAPAVMPHAFSIATQVVSGPIFLTAVQTAMHVPSHLPPLPLIIWTVWICGFMAVAAGWAREWLRIRAIAKAASPLPLGLPIRAVSVPARLEPGVVGIFRPVLLLPEGIAARLTPAQLQAVLAHELCHVRRRDNLTAAVHMLVEALFWFHPLVWWLGSRLMDERERACDEEVLRLGGEPEAYAEGILNVCKSYVESPVACISGISGSDLKKRVVRIMTEPAARKLDFSKKLWLSAAGLMAVAAPIVFGQVNVAQSGAGTQAEDTTAIAPVYEVASIKPDKSGSGGVRIMFTPDGFTATNVSLQMLLREAYGVEDDRISGTPSWVNSEKYDIQAKMDSSVADALRKLSPDQGKLERQHMLEALLADRFKLTLHHETREHPLYALVIAKNGPKLQEAKPGDTYPNGIKNPEGRSGGHLMRMERPGHLTGQALSMADLVRLLSQQLGRTVLDKTGLTGNYDFTLQWTPDVSQGPMFTGPDGGKQGTDNTAPPESSGPSIFTAIQEQLGLKLESQKGPMEVLVIDHVEEPSPN